ncbi:MAG: PAS domain S-box protein [Proteobacteria bacterium]|nr:PAS domain S-box protein [Pseudomonadota bacterium]
MAVDTANRAAEGLLPAALLSPARRAELLANPLPAFIVAANGVDILWSSHEAARRLGLRDAENAMAKGLPLRAAGTERLAQLGRQLDADAAKRLERLRFNIGFRSVALTGLCQPLALADGTYAMYVALIEARAPRDEFTPPDMAEAGPEAPSFVDLPLSAAMPAALPEPPRPAWLDKPTEERRPIRFVFELDSNGIVERVSPPLAEAVGTAQAEVLGQPLAMIVGAFDPQAAEAIRGAVLGGETWNGISVAWPVEGTDLVIPVQLSALPLHADGHALTGYSGFGRCQIDLATPRVSATPEAEAQSSALDEAEVPVAVEESQAEALSTAETPAPSIPDDDAATMLEEAPSVLELADAEAPALDEAGEGEAENTAEPAVENVEPSPAPRVGLAQDNRAPAKIIALRPGPASIPEQPAHIKSGLSMSERNAFREIAKALGARFDADETLTLAPPGTPAPAIEEEALSRPAPAAPANSPAQDSQTAILDALPVGILVMRDSETLFANRTLLELAGYADLATFIAEEGGKAIFRKGALPRAREDGFDTIVLASRTGETFPVDAHLQQTEWKGAPASLVSLRRALEIEQGKALRSVALDLRAAKAETAELRSILDTATDGVATLDGKGAIISLNGAAEALFGLDQNEVIGASFTCLLRNESHALALDYFDGLKANGVRSVLNDGREVVGREKKGGPIPLFMTLGRISDGEPQRYCAVLRDLTAWKRAEAELTQARRDAELASAKKSDFLTKISHEIRTPMNAIIGFAEVMLEERLGAIGNAKYKEYIGDIRTSGKHVVSLVNDLLDLAKIEAGRMEMNFAATDLNTMLTSTVAIIQPQANANRVLVRTQLAQKLPPVVADERSIRQIVLNMLSNATRFTEAGGQVIVATALLDSGEAVIRIRDTGIGMSPREIEQALEPFRQVGTRRDNSGTGLGLPLTKALVEANRASFSIRSNPGEGTMIEITFPSTRVLAE